MGEKVYFQQEKVFRHDVEVLFSQERAKLQSLLPYADIHHVGSTAVPGSLTKGDLDIQVRVEQENFNQAKETLLKVYEANKGSVVSDTFMAFKNDNTYPPLGIQLTVKDSLLDIFWKITEVLKENKKLSQQYDQIKQQFNGKNMEEYREAKARFLTDLMKTDDYKNK